MKQSIRMTILATITCAVIATFGGTETPRDVVIYGGTSGGIAAAVEAHRLGKSVVIVEPSNRIGGLTTGGLGQTDIGNKAAFGGIALEFYRAVAAWYKDERHWTRQKRGDYLPDGQCAGTLGTDSMWTFEPSAALAILNGWLTRDGIEVVYGARLDRSSGGVTKTDGRIAAFRTEDGRIFKGKVFVDATYEGDLLAAAGVSYTVGREGNDVYGETINGIQRARAVSHQFWPGVDPYVVKGDSSSGLLPGVEKDCPEPDGTGDRRVQAYCFRMCLTDDPANRIPFRKPASYRALDYELLLRQLEAGEAIPSAKKLGWQKSLPWINSKMPNRKTDTNNRQAVSSDFIGANWAWPEASYAERDRILQAHLAYQQGLMWTLANHPRVPEWIRKEVSKWGTCKDEFTDGLGDGWQRQLYVREARRMVGETVMTEHHCRGTARVARPVAMGAYGMDSHNCRRYVDADGFVRNEGDIQDHKGADGKRLRPYSIDYGAIIPKRNDCRNLLVPVCVSASHMAYGSIRMEPAFFALGHAAGAAAALAIDAGADVQDVDYAQLRARLLADGQVIEQRRDKMTVSFNEKNVLQSITVGVATFATGGGDLWTAEFSDGTNRAARARVAARDAASCSRTETDTKITLVWRDIPVNGERGMLDATVTIEKRPDGSQAWNLAFANRSPRWTLMTTAFPRLNRVTPDDAGDVLLPANDHGAQLFKKRVAQPRPFRRAYLGYCPMIAGFFLGTDGLYFVPEDPEARIKSLVVEGEQNAFYETTVENAGVPGLAAEGPRYPVVLAPLKGDWWSFARRYRAYALKQKWAARGPIKDIPDYPRRLSEIPLWINIHGYPNVASNVLTRAKAIFPGFSTGLHWHLWQHSGHDVNYPEYFPAQPGTKECIAYCETLGQEPMPYVNGRLWSAPTSGFILAEPYAVLRQDDTRYVEKYGRLTAPLAVMCPTCAPWQKVVRTFTGRILDELGAKSIFIDQIGAAPGIPCYDPAHGHPLGGGAWWREGYEKMMEPIHRAWNAKGAFITTEGSGEMCLNMVDGYLQVVVRDPKDIPFHNAVYSGYTTYFCSPENNDDDPTAFRALQTRELLWGNALGWFLPDILGKPDKCAILNQLCAFRQKNLDALAYGNLLDELRFAEPVGKTTYEWLGRRPHHSLYDPAYKLPPSKFATMADVRGNWWRTADGKVVLLAANLTDREQRVVYRIYGTDKTATLTLAPYELVRK